MICNLVALMKNYLFVGGYRQTSDDKEQNRQNKLPQNFNLHAVNRLVFVKHNACTCILATIRLMLAKTVFVNDNMLLYKYQALVEQTLTCIPYYGLDGLSMHIMNTYLIQTHLSHARILHRESRKLHSSRCYFVC